MKFCNKCDNMFYLGINKSNPNDITHYCRYCGNVDESASQNSSCIINTSTDYINDNNNMKYVYLCTYCDHTWKNE